jgi:hypothetical protein
MFLLGAAGFGVLESRSLSRLGDLGAVSTIADGRFIG